MPLYEFRCRNCRNVFELLLPRGSTADVHCPKCGSSDVQRLMSAFVIGGQSKLFEDVSISEKDIPKPLKDTFPPDWKKRMAKYMS